MTLRHLVLAALLLASPALADERGIDRIRDSSSFIGTPGSQTYSVVQDSSSSVAKKLIFRDAVRAVMAGATDATPIGTGTLLPTIDNTYDVGSTAKRWRQFIGVNARLTALVSCGAISTDSDGDLTCSAAVPGATLVVADAAADTTTFCGLWGSATGSLPGLTDAGCAYNAATDTLTVPTFVGALTGNASTATALLSNGGNCSAGSFPLGVDASGASESCTAVDTAYVDALNVDADTIDGLNSTAFQGVDATLTSIAALGTAADRYAYTTGIDTWAEGTITAFARTILDDADAATVRATIGAGTGGGDALTANPLSQFAATTSLQLKGVISDENGTGAAIFDSSTSQTLITPILSGGTSGSVLHTTTGGVITHSAGITYDGTTFLVAGTGLAGRFSRSQNSTTSLTAVLDNPSASAAPLGNFESFRFNDSSSDLYPAATIGTVLTARTAGTVSGRLVLGTTNAGTATTDRVYIEPDGTVKVLGLTSNGFVKTGGGDGTLSVDTSTYLTTADAATTYQPLDADLTSWAAVTRAAGWDAFAVQALGATTTILVGGGVGSAPVWTTATGTGAPVRATSPTLVTPTLGVAVGTSLALGIATAEGLLHVSDADFADTGLFERTTTGTTNFLAAMRVLATTTSASADGFGPAMTFAIRDSSGATINPIAVMGAQRAGADNTGRSVFGTYVAGVYADRLYLDNTAAFPATAGGIALGKVTGGFSSLFLDDAASGRTVQFVSPTIAADIVLATPAVTGTLATLAGTEEFSNKTLANPTLLKMGTGSGTAKPRGTWYAPTNETAGNSAVTTEETMFTTTLPASALGSNGEYVLIRCRFYFNANANTKTAKIYFGSTVVWTAGPAAINNGQVSVSVLVRRTAAAAQRAIADGWSDNATVGTYTHTLTTPTETLSGTVVIKATVQSGTAAANNIIAEGFIVEYGYAN